MARSPAIWKLPAANEPKPLVNSMGTGPVPPVAPYTWGSTRSRLVDLLRAGHQQVTLSAEELDRIITWIDLNAPYYPDYADYYTDNTYGRSPLNQAQLLRLGQLVSAAPGGREWGWNRVDDYVGGRLNALLGRGELPINFTRPELSACLRAFPQPSTPNYAEALGLIQAGQDILAQHPRADLPGFKPGERDQGRLDFYAERQRIEQRNRRAIREGRKVYDDRPGAE